MTATEFIEVDLAEDVQEFITLNADVCCPADLKAKILAFDKKELVRVKKSIGSSFKILEATIVTDEMLQNIL